MTRSTERNTDERIPTTTLVIALVLLSMFLFDTVAALQWTVWWWQHGRVP